MKQGINRLSAVRSMIRRFSMPRKWLLAYIVLIVLPASVILYSYYQRSAALVEDGVTNSMQQTMKQAAINLTYRLEHVQDISNSAFMNPKLYEYLESSGDSSIGKQLEVVKDLRALVNTVQTNTDVFRFRLFVDKSELVAGDRINFFSMESLQNRPWYRQIMEANGAIVWTGLYKEQFIDLGETYILSCARMMHDPNRYDQVAGILMVDVAEKTIADILSDLELTKQSRIYVADANGTIVYHSDKSLIGSPMPDNIGALVSGASDGKQKIRANNDAAYVVYSTIRPTGWKLVAEIPASEISQSAVKQNQYSGIVALLGIFSLFLVLVFVLLAFIVRGMNRRVQQVIGVIRREGVDRLDELHAGNGDFSMLERSVDQLIVRIRQLVEQTYAVRVQEREAQLRALQAQINPHFLYNTLDTINWIAIGRGAADISQMIDALAKYFRLSLNRGQDNVSVRDELNLAQVYLDIQMSRFPGSFEYDVEANPDVLSLVMPKLTLQPIVENALLHGIRKTKDKRGTIRIAAERAGDDLVVTVSDDGIGMEEERAQRLLVEMPAAARPDGSGSSYGLFNVNERIKLFAGEEYGLGIRSRPGAGTTVIVRLKVQPTPPSH